MPSRPRSAVRLTKIYTRTGDDGTSALGDLSRVRKTDPRLGAYADTDETNAAIGAALALGELDDKLVAVLTEAQNDLFDVGADLSLPISDDTRDRLRVTPAYVKRLEKHCDTFNKKLAPLTSFILPGGTPGGALLHVARTVCRRAERSAWALIEAEPERTNVQAAKYLNRLSDLLFILARTANAERGDVLWQPGSNA